MPGLELSLLLLSLNCQFSLSLAVLFNVQKVVIFAQCFKSTI